MNAQTRSAAHILLDLYSSSQTGDGAGKERAFGVSMQRLNETDALTASQNDDGELALDITPILTAAGISYQWLFDQLEAATGRSLEELTFELRTVIDSLTE